jgi:methyl-accepting chemotaxis protein PixJ
MANRIHTNGTGDSLNPSQHTTPPSDILAHAADPFGQADSLGAIAQAENQTYLSTDLSTDFSQIDSVQSDSVQNDWDEAISLEDPLIASVPGKQRGASLNQQILTTVVPGVLLPLGVVGLMGYGLASQQAGKTAERELQNQVLAAGESANDLLQEALKIPAIVANDPPVIDFAHAATQEAEIIGLTQESLEGAEQRFSATKLVLDNGMNDYVSSAAQVGQFVEFSVTERYGFNIAYNRQPSDFVQSDESWWQQAKEGNSPVIEMGFDASTNMASVALTHAITDPNTNEFLGTVRGVLPASYFNRALQALGNVGLSGTEQVQILAPTADGNAIALSTVTAEGTSDSAEVLGGDPVKQQVANLVARSQATSTRAPGGTLVVEAVANQNGDRTLLTNAVDNGRLYSMATIPGTNWIAVASVDQSATDGSGRGLILLFASLFVIMGGVAAAIAAYLARRLSSTMDQLTQVAEQVAAGNLNVYAEAKGPAEARRLAHSFNHLVTQVKSLLQKQAEAVKQAQFFTDMANAASRGDNQRVFDQAVQAAKKQMAVDRVVIYAFEQDYSGSIVAEAVDPGWPRALKDKITDPCIPKQILEEYRRGRFVPTSDLQATDYSPAHKQLLQRLEVKANLVVPVVAGEQLLGLMVAHQCSGTRVWKQSEIGYLRELASQVGLALTGVTLAAQKSAEAERAQMLKDVTLRIRQSLNTQDILQMSVEEVRRATKSDRVVIYRFNSDWKSGVVTAESVGAGWIKALGQNIADPLGEGDIDRFNSGRIWTRDNVDEAGLTQCHCKILEKLQVKANIVAPVMRNGQLYALLCGHQCSGPRIWQDSEIDLFAQFSAQIGFALDQALLLEQQAIAVQQANQINEITSRIRETLQLDQIYSTAVSGVREAMKCDRAVVYLFDEKWKGKVVAESVGRGFPVALGAEIDDPCFAESYISKYVKGRVHATPNIYEAGLTDCYLKQLEPFGVKANLVAPILANKKLIGLLISHQCSGPRDWQENDITFMRQIAVQIGFALDQATLLSQQALVANRAQQLNEITSQMREFLEPENIYKAALQGTREALSVDRVIFYLFDEDWKGKVVAESVARGFPVALNANINDPCFAQSYIEKYKRGRVQALNNIYEANLDKCYLSQLEPFEVKANIVAPVLIHDNLLGLLVCHQCSAPREWQQNDIDFVYQVAIQLGFALEQAKLFEQKEQARIAAEALSEERRQQKEEIQRQLVDLLTDVEGASRGDLTVRADVTAGEIGTVADFFNSIVESLRQIVTKVKQSALQVNAALGDNEGAIRQLADEALQQADETTRTLDSVEAMTLSIQTVANNARQAETVARMASMSAEQGGVAMDLTVQNILNLRETVGETAKKVKRLGESSQQISKVVSLINQIALQTNLLAINAGIEAARAGEEGQGFAVVAEEVGELAARSATATQEIEQIVENIQRETSQVVEAMELGTAQVVEGTRLVEDAKQSLGQILEVSHQIDQLVQSISHATVSQVETSQAVKELMQEIAQVSKRTSVSSRQVSGSLRQTVEVAKELQASVGMFKVGSEA